LREGGSIDGLVGIDVVYPEPGFALPVFGHCFVRDTVLGLQCFGVELADTSGERSHQILVRGFVVADLDPDDVGEIVVACPRCNPPVKAALRGR
jgi:hypothetical protein